MNEKGLSFSFRFSSWRFLVYELSKPFWGRSSPTSWKFGSTPHSTRISYDIQEVSLTGTQIQRWPWLEEQEPWVRRSVVEMREGAHLWGRCTRPISATTPYTCGTADVRGKMLGVRTGLTPQRQELIFSSFFNGGNSPLIEMSSRKILGSRFEADEN